MRRTRRTQSTGPLLEDQWAACGIVLVTFPDGTKRPTHVRRGDDYADAVIHGRIDVETARRDHAAAQDVLDRWRQRGAQTPAEFLLRLMR
jgi:hypothetical protein